MDSLYAWLLKEVVRYFLAAAHQDERSFQYNFTPMLPRALRMSVKDFKGQKTRLIYRGAFFDISVASGEITKFACIVAKKRIKRAVDRNKAKRKVYSLLTSVSPSTPFLIFVYPTKNILQAPHQVLASEIEKAFATL